MRPIGAERHCPSPPQSAGTGAPKRRTEVALADAAAFPQAAAVRPVEDAGAFVGDLRQSCLETGRDLGLGRPRKAAPIAVDHGHIHRGLIAPHQTTIPGAQAAGIPNEAFRPTRDAVSVGVSGARTKALGKRSPGFLQGHQRPAVGRQRQQRPVRLPQPRGGHRLPPLLLQGHEQQRLALLPFGLQALFLQPPRLRTPDPRRPSAQGPAMSAKSPPPLPG